MHRALKTAGRASGGFHATFKRENWVGGWLTPPLRLTGRANARVVTLLFLHGGGYAVGTALQYQESLRNVVDRLRGDGVHCEVLAVEYPLSTEAPFPSALIASAEGYRVACTRAERHGGGVVVMGDSAGGGLAAALAAACVDASLVDEGVDAASARALKAAVDGLPVPTSLVLVSPWTDFRLSNPSIQANKHFDFLAAPDGPPAIPLAPRTADSTGDSMVTFASLYAAHLGPAAITHPLVNLCRLPARVLGSFPPTQVLVGGREVLLDDGVGFASALGAAKQQTGRTGGSSTHAKHPHQLVCDPAMVHVYAVMPRVVPRHAERGAGRIADFIASTCGFTDSPSGKSRTLVTITEQPIHEWEQGSKDGSRD